MLRAVRSGGATGRVKRSPPSAAVRRAVPVRTFSDWGDPAPGFFEADLVAHSGPSGAGSFVQTLVITDIASGWTEFAPLLVREQRLLTEVLGVMQTQLTMPILGFDTDNDSVFMNETVQAWCAQTGAKWPCCTEVSKGATAPSWNHLRNADEIGLPEFAHSVERFDRDCNFGHTASVIARLQGISDDALVATDRRFNFRAPVVASRLLPVHPPVRIDGENMLVSLGWRCRSCWPSHGSFAWRRDEFRAISERSEIGFGIPESAEI